MRRLMLAISVGLGLVGCGSADSELAARQVPPVSSQQPAPSVASIVTDKSAAPAATSASAATSTPDAEAAASNGEDPREAQLQVGEEYDYTLMTHCGIEWARIGGSWWRTDPLNDGNANPPGGWANPSQVGRIRMESADSIVFTGGPDPLVFVRTEITDFDDPRLPDSVRFCD